jgi:hypothetical protein
MRPVLSLLAATALLAGACGGTAGTPSPTPVPTPTPAPTPIRDPEELLARSMSAVLDAESFHVRADFSGRASASILGGGGSILGALGASVDLAGSRLEGDVDVAGRAADLAFEVPGFPFGLNGRAIAVGGSLYSRLSILGDGYSRSSTGEALAALDAVAPPGGDRPARIEALRRALREAGVTSTMLALTFIDGRLCYHVSIAVPIDRLNASLSQAGGYAARVTVVSAAAEYWADEETLLPARLEVVADAGSMGNVRAVVVFSRYGEPVTVEAPDPSQVH